MCVGVSLCVYVNVGVCGCVGLGVGMMCVCVLAQLRQLAANFYAGKRNCLTLKENSFANFIIIICNS